VTYSLVARDAESGQLGVAVQSRAFGTAAACAWARAGVGAIATQSFTDSGYGPRGLDLLAAGRAPADALAELLAADERRDFRQVAFLAAHGDTAAHTGDACVPVAGDVAGDGVSAQGNMLASEDVVPAMVEAFSRSRGELGERLLDALDAAEAAGGDFRGRQAAGLVVVDAEPADEPWEGRLFDLRVEDADQPLGELRRLYRLAAGYRRRTKIGPESSPEEEAEAARAAGLRADEADFAAALAAARAGDLDDAARRLKPYSSADMRWREAFERYERLGLLPSGVLDRLA
jgi:uncharacterized Ntn-hydrolase superfamily protein